MPKRNYGLAKRPLGKKRHVLLAWMVGVLLTGCATPQYAIRPTPQPVESAAILRIERAISAAQAKQFQEQGGAPHRARRATLGIRRAGHR